MSLKRVLKTIYRQGRRSRKAIFNLGVLIDAQRLPLLGWFAKEMLALRGIEIPTDVQIGQRFDIRHRGFGLVINPRTRIGNRVTVYHGVTVGHALARLQHPDESGFEGIVLEDDVVLFAGCAVLGGPGTLTVGRGTCVAANAMLLNSTGEYEIWAGVPAKLVGKRKHGHQ